MATSNELQLDEFIAYQIGLLQLSARIRDRVIAVLNATEAEVVDKIVSRLANHEAFRGIGDQRRVQVLRRIINNIRGAAWDEANNIWVEEITAVARADSRFAAMILNTTAPVILDLTALSSDDVDKILRQQPFEGRVLREWAKKQKTDDLARIQAQIRIGMIQGETSRQIASRIVGTTRRRNSGVTGTTRRNMEAVTLTAINFVSNASRREFYAQNKNILSTELFVATLDSRTTPICRSFDGDVFPIAEGPLPPLHFRCRSLRVALLNGQILGNRPFKTSTERSLVREFLRSRGMTPKAQRRKDLPFGLKGQFDKFARPRIRELTGQVPARTSYGDWLRRQSAEFQDEVLGPTRGKLFRRGGLDLKNFVRRDGSQVTLEELVKRHERNFRRAGLNPADF
jgi:SPP1 gp7 family putative phage head morphogenesis protein